VGGSEEGEEGGAGEEMSAEDASGVQVGCELQRLRKEKKCRRTNTPIQVRPKVGMFPRAT